MFLASAAALRGLHNDNADQALIDHARILSGIIYGADVISAETIKDGQQYQGALGPRRVMITAGTAAVFELGSKQSRVSGPETICTQRFERVTGVYDLHKHPIKLNIDDILTKDGALVRLTLSAIYGPDVRSEVSRGKSALDKSEQLAIQRQHEIRTLTQSNVRQSIFDTLEAATRRAVGNRSLDDLRSGDGYARLDREILRFTEARAQSRGITVVQIITEDVDPHPQLEDVYMDEWAADRRAKLLSKQEVARATAWRDAIRLISDGYMIARKRGMPDYAIARFVLTRMLETIAENSETRLYLTPDLLSIIGSLRDSGSPRT